MVSCAWKLSVGCEATSVCCFLAHRGWLDVCVCLAPSGLLVSDVMVIVVEGELRGRRRYLFCVCVGC